jgi:hypothetical protein
MSLFIFSKAKISSKSVDNGEADIDLFAVPIYNLANITSTQGVITLYFKDGGSYSNFTGGTSNVRGYEYTQVDLQVNNGLEQEVIREIAKTLLTKTTILIDFVNRNISINNIKSILSIKRFNNLTTLTTDPSSGGGTPAGGDLDQVLTKLSSVDGDVDWLYPHTLFLTVRNVSGGTLPKGTPVHATGVTGTVADVIAADAAIPSAMPATYVLNQSIANNAQGIAIIVGTITGVDTSSFSPGDVIFVAAGGGYTNVKPTGTNLIQNIGVVTKSNVTTGSGVIYGSGRSNDVPNLPTGKFFIGSATNTTQSTYTLPTADGAAGQQLQTDGAGAVTFQTPNPNVVYSDANKVDHTGSTSNTLMTSFLLPANTLDDGDLLYLLARTNRPSPQATNANIRYYANTVNSLSGATLIGSGAQMSSTARYSVLERTYAILNQTTDTNAFGASSLILSDMFTTTLAPSTLAIDWTAAQYIIIAGQLANVADTISVIYFFAEITKQKV